jgi:hypothetical protein
MEPQFGNDLAGSLCKSMPAPGILADAKLNDSRSSPNR